MNISDNPQRLFSVAKDCMERLVNRAVNLVIPTGFNAIDNLVGGFQSPQVMLLAGRPYAGKTALLLNLAMNVTRDSSIPVAMFSPGHSNVEIVLKSFSQCGIDSSKFRDSSKLLMEDLSSISEVQDSLKGLPLYIDDTQFQTLEDFAYKVAKLVNGNGVKMVFIDGMEFFSFPGSLTSVEQRALMLQTLRQLADKFSITIIASERFRNIPDSRPIDLKEYESKGFPQEVLKEYVDVAAVLSRPGVYGNDCGDDSAQIRILHNNNGRRDIVLGLHFVPECYSFKDIEETL